MSVTNDTIIVAYEAIYRPNTCIGEKMASIDLKKGSYNRLWVVLATLAYKEGNATTLKELSELSGLPRSSTEDILNKVLDGQIPGMLLKRHSATFTVIEWGTLLNKKQLLAFYKTHLKDK